MTHYQIISIMIPLQAAHDYAVLANSAPKEERAGYEELMLNRLRHAAENAGLIAAEEKAA